jgi:pyridoxal phosphate enzyme (YggS family)
MSDLATNLSRVRAAIAEAALNAGRTPDEITLVGASKTVTAERVAEAISAGLTNLGENFVQEAEAKIPLVSAIITSPVTWHMIGHLQTNKVKAALHCFNIIESVDSHHLATAISRRASAQPVDILLEIYLGSDDTRPGFRPSDLCSEFELITQLAGIRVRGLMTVAPVGLDDDSTRRVFREVRELRDRLQERYPEQQLTTLSMGMTDDFPLAIREGATAIRVGRAIFGARPS